jgi:hypothetical protein
MKVKDFQSATVDKVIDAFKSTNIFLVADEVGLGKTIVAKEIIRRLYREYTSRRKPFHVIYICSNQVLAEQNIRKLDLNPIENSGEGIHRLLLLAQRKSEESIRKNKKSFIISTLTPSTSFKMTNSRGIAEERAVLYRILRDKAFRGIARSKKRIRALKKMLKGGCSKDSWKWWSGVFQRDLQLQPDLAKSFQNRLAETGLLKSLCRFLDKESEETGKDLIWKLRDALTNLCAENYLQADLFILDEFQRLRDLLETGEDRSQAALLAEKVFRSGKKILLLSATPFNPYSTHFDSTEGDDYYKEFNRVFEFLLRGKGEVLRDINEKRKMYFQALTGWEKSQDTESVVRQLMEAKKALEKDFFLCMARTERTVVEEQEMVRSGKSALDLMATTGDLKHFRSLDQIYRSLPIKSAHHSLIEFSTTAPWALSFLKGYKIRDGVNTKIQDQIGGGFNTDAVLPYAKINEYLPIFDENTEHARMKLLLQETLYDGASDLLWIPPALPYYKAEGPFVGKAGYSKTLLFSSWVMAPRAIAAILSYEAERLSIAAEAGKEGKEEGPKTYFAQETHRTPKPQLVFTTQEGKDHFTNACLLYPSWYLAELMADSRITKDGSETADQLRKHIIEAVRTDFPKLFIHAKGRATRQHYWYWYSLFYLAKKRREEEWTTYWLDDESFFTAEEDNEEESKTKVLKGKEKFLEELSKQIDYNHTNKESIKEVPENLAEVIADMVLGSPAICAYRTLKELYPKEPEENIISYATKIAGGFFTLYNKPESIAIIRRNIPGGYPYWQKCLKYGIAGNIQSLLDEYCLLLRENYSYEKEPRKLVSRIVDVLKMKTTSIYVDLYDEKTHSLREEKMHCHFAVNYGTQSIETTSGRNRMIGVRDAFNSPFRPFVVASTSIGQEGLDFHCYCRKIFHWNLPHNAIDLEQRDGRINRYKGHAIRLNLADRYASRLPGSLDIGSWDSIYRMAERDSEKYCNLVPYWHLNMEHDLKYPIERFVPLYLFSKEKQKYRTLCEVLTYYRLTFGQPHQEHLITTLFETLKNKSIEEIQNIISKISLNLAPITHCVAQA